MVKKDIVKRKGGWKKNFSPPPPAVRLFLGENLVLVTPLGDTPCHVDQMLLTGDTRVII